MVKPKICLTLTGKTLQEDADFVKKYSKHIDIVEFLLSILISEHVGTGVLDCPLEIDIKKCMWSGIITYLSIKISL